MMWALEACTEWNSENQKLWLPIHSISFPAILTNKRQGINALQWVSVAKTQSQLPVLRSAIPSPRINDSSSRFKLLASDDMTNRARCNFNLISCLTWHSGIDREWEYEKNESIMSRSFEFRFFFQILIFFFLFCVFVFDTNV